MHTDRDTYRSGNNIKNNQKIVQKNKPKYSLNSHSPVKCLNKKYI